ncbi:maleylacetoacetate isomerase [Hyphococcus luteus]|uniref:Maleylacetoacetate isomerase n=1 Tax=Hyphococcus luteus TaxID=2058213 RepID=A0A2S7K972_9PROT|nr:maleylacetoacetate isomerase [Marinicaulis flavus]PQA89056.1 maleylacetoacetate isomerase [Marinicaulis flavus]
MKLFGYWRSSATYRVRIALALKNLPYDYEAVHLLKGEQNSEAYRAKNPLGLVPTLQTDDGALLVQSSAIIEYLEETFSEPPLLPGGAIARAQARAVAATLASEAQPFGNSRIQKYLKNERGFDADAMNDWMNRWPGGAMAAVEKMLAHTAGDYCVGDVPGLADCFLVPQMYAAHRFGIDVSGFAKMNEIHERCLKHPAFEKAHPDNQPDAVTS